MCSALHEMDGGWRCESCDWAAERRNGFPEFLSSSDRESPLIRSYLDNYESIATDDLTGSIQNEDYLRIQAERLFFNVGDVRGLSVCEIGVGKGGFFELARKGGTARLVGVDIVVPYLERYEADDGVRLVLANVENLPFVDEFDLVVAAEVMEHVINLGDALLSIRRALRPGGHFVARVPYKDDLSTYARQRGVKYDLVHLRDFNKENLKRQLKAAGFELEGLRFDGFYPGKKRRYFMSVPAVALRCDAEPALRGLLGGGSNQLCPRQDPDGA